MTAEVVIERDRWDVLTDRERWARPVLTDRQRAWAATRGGPRLAQLLADVDLATLTDAETLAYAQAVRRQQSWTDSLLLAATRRFAAHRPGPDPQQESLLAGTEHRVQLGGELTPGVGSFAVAEWAVALRITHTAAQRLIADALDLTFRLSGVAMAARIGHTDTTRARMVATLTRELPAELAADLEQRLIPHLATLTRRRLEAMIDRLLETQAPQLRQQRAEAVRERREVYIEHTNDDHAEIAGTLDTTAARLLDERLNSIADQLRLAQATHPDTGFGPAGEDRHQRRARALGLLAEPGRLAALARLVGNAQQPAGTDHHGGADPAGSDKTDADDLAATDADAAATRPVTLYLHLRPDNSIDLEGVGPIARATAVELLTAASVTVRPVIDLNTQIVSTGYRPSPRLREQMLLIKDTCFFPHCDVPARGCDFEHTIPAPRGPTATGNAGPACRYHHRIKTHGDWQVRQPFPGIYLWRSPTGNIYTVDNHATHEVAASR
jgi:hypothetical protein